MYTDNLPYHNYEYQQNKSIVIHQLHLQLYRHFRDTLTLNLISRFRLYLHP